MRRISVPVDSILETLTDFGLSAERAHDIIALFEVIDAGDIDVLVMPPFPFNYSQLPRKVVLITLSAFWICVISNTKSASEQELQALGALRSLYFVAVNLGNQDLAEWIAKYWEETSPLHGCEALECWS